MIKKIFTTSGMIIGFLLVFFLLTGWAAHWGQPYLKESNDKKISIRKDAWPNIFGEGLIYTVEIFTQNEDLFIYKKFENPLKNSIYYYKPSGEKIDFIRIENDGVKIILTPLDKENNPEIFLEADKKFGLVKKEIGTKNY